MTFFDPFLEDFLMTDQNKTDTQVFNVNQSKIKEVRKVNKAKYINFLLNKKYCIFKFNTSIKLWFYCILLFKYGLKNMSEIKIFTSQLIAYFPLLCDQNFFHKITTF